MSFLKVLLRCLSPRLSRPLIISRDQAATLHHLSPTTQAFASMHVSYLRACLTTCCKSFHSERTCYMKVFWLYQMWQVEPPAVLLSSLFSCSLLLGPAGRCWVYTLVNVGQRSLARGFDCALFVFVARFSGWSWHGLSALWHSVYLGLLNDSFICKL